uniref:Uncharacterized protein n=1 Tax=Rhizophagus irregularis (strain DAOM 181602 / DAOM 197198 / MUCL 43194) TaxID=747089 RepID=U9UQ56_RHIID
MDVLFVEIEEEIVLDANGDGSTANMIKVRALNHVVKEVTDAVIHIAVSAGNDSKNACGQSPAPAPSDCSRF